jgi:hypothetical protein
MIPPRAASRDPREDEIRFVSLGVLVNSETGHSFVSFVSRPTPAPGPGKNPGVASTPETLARYHSKDGSAPLGNHKY